MLVQQRPHLLLSPPAAGNLRLYITEPFLWYPHVGQNGVHKRVVALALAVELDHGKTHSLLKTLRTLTAKSTWKPAACIGVMRIGEVKGYNLPLPEDRGNDRRIGHMSHAGVGIVGQDHIAGLQFASPFLQYIRHKLHKGRDLQRCCISKAGRPSLAITDGSGEVTNLDHCRATCLPHRN